MKPIKPSAPAGLAAILFLAGVVMHSNAEPETKLANDDRMERLRKLPASQFTKVIDHSTSPNKRLAVVLGSKDGTKPAWHQQEGQEGEFSFTFEGPDDAANYLINVQDDRVVAILDGSYSAGTLKEYNHTGYAAIWSPDSRWLVELQEWRWSTWPCTAHRMNAKGLPAGRIGLKPMAEKCVDEQLRKLSPKLTAEEREGYAIKIYDSEITNDGEFSARISADAPKQLEDKYVSVALSVTAKIEESNKDTLSIRVTKVSIPTANKPEQNDR